MYVGVPGRAKRDAFEVTWLVSSAPSEMVLEEPLKTRSQLYHDDGLLHFLLHFTVSCVYFISPTVTWKHMKPLFVEVRMAR